MHVSTFHSLRPRGARPGDARARHPRQLHLDLRSGRLLRHRQRDPARAELGQGATTSARSSRASRTRRTRSSTPEACSTPSARQRRRRVRRDHRRVVYPQLQRRAPLVPGVRLRRSRLRGRAPLAARARRARPSGGSASATSSSTSTRTRTARSSSWCACSAASTGTCASSATTTSRSTRGAAPTCATSSTSRRTSPARRWSSSSRTTAPRSADPRRRERGHREAQRRAAREDHLHRRASGEGVELVVCAASGGGGGLRRAARSSASVERGVHRPKDFAVLYRSNRQSGDIESALKERQIPIEDDRRPAVLRAQGGEGSPRLPQASR